MDVTFASSGALSRAHYSIVRKVETAPSLQQADQLLALEIKSVHERLSRSPLSIKQCKASLVILLYISTATSPGFLPSESFDFALSHALNLAEIGKTIEDKRIGYLFCAELMPPEHELRLMMVNTLRKDLESGSPGRMCLALDNLIAFSNEDILPAVQDLILDLLSHNYPHIRRRAILALRSLSVYDPVLLSQGSETILKRLQDRNEWVVGSALAVAAGLSTSDHNYSNVRHIVNGLFSSIGISNGSAMTLRILQCLQSLGLSESHIAFAMELVKSFSSSGRQAPLLGIFRLLSQHSPSKLIEAENAQDISTVRCIRDLLTSHHVNDHYLYLACLLCMDPGVWAGTTPSRPLILEGWEVEKIMQFLESPDDLIRKMTLNLLARIDTTIVDTYLTRVLEGVGPGLDLATLSVFASRMLDIVAVLSLEDGGRYAQGTKQVLGRLDEVLDRPRVVEGAVETVLVHIRMSGSDFRISCATTLLTYLVDSNGSPGPTFLVISSALAVEYIASISISPSELLKVFATTLKTSTPIVQDASLLGMLRLVAEADDPALELAKQEIETLEKRAGPRIRKRCGQVLQYLSDRTTLRDIVQSLVAQTLPEFLEALERPKQSQADGKTSLGSNDALVSSPKLRYAAYDQPQPVTSLWRSRSSSTHGSIRSDITSEERQSVSREAAEMSLAAVSLGMKLEEETKLKKASSGADRSDLITLDSPFVTEGNEEEASISDEFERIWNKLPDESHSRGWCDESVEVLVRRLQGLGDTQVRVGPSDLAPFIGELKVVLTRGREEGAVRLKESEEDSCLWRLKCEGGWMKGVFERENGW